MKKSYLLSRKARTDLLKVWKYLAKNVSAEVADEVIEGLYSGMDRLSRSPDVGHLRRDLTELPVRFFRVDPYLIVYAPQEKPLGIVRVLHGARDIPAILRGD